MRLVRQRYMTDCSIAVAATVAGVGYERMRSRAITLLWKGRAPSSYCTCHDDIRRLLRSFGVRTGRSVGCRSWAKVPDRAIVRIRYANGNGHAVLFTRDERGRQSCYDPWLDKVRTDLHKMRPPTHYIEVT